MAITDNQKIDYLFKKIGYGATKTDTNAINLLLTKRFQVRYSYVAIEFGNNHLVFPA